MSIQEIPSPQELWNNLLNIDPNHFNDGFPDIALLRDYFQRYSNREESKSAKLSFQTAIDHWNDEQIKEFVYLLTESQLSSSVSEGLHTLLVKAYKEIFGP